MSEITVILWGSLASILAGLATGVGALPILFKKEISEKLLDVLLGFAAGVMLAATFFSLLMPAISLASIWVASLGLILGALVMSGADRFAPHLHLVKGREGPDIKTLSRVELFILAITIHNFPEGLAVGVGFGAEQTKTAIRLTIAIGLQNMPEGLAVALPLVREKFSPLRALLIATLTGLVEPIAGILGVSLVTIFKPILPLGMAFAGGAMLFVISNEIIPETHRRGYEKEATFGVISGFIVMMILDNLFSN